MTLAPPILAGVPGSFAHGVFHERHPKLIDQIIGAHPYPHSRPKSAAATARREHPRGDRAPHR